MSRYRWKQGIKNMRPTSITILCIILFVIGFSQLTGSLIIAVAAPNFPSMVAVTINSIAVYAYYGLWQMQKWSVIAFLVIWIFYFVSLSFSPIQGTAVGLFRGWVIILVTGIYLFFVLPHWNKFSNERPFQRISGRQK